MHCVGLYVNRTKKEKKFRSRRKLPKQRDGYGKRRVDLCGGGGGGAGSRYHYSSNSLAVETKTTVCTHLAGLTQATDQRC